MDFFCWIYVRLLIVIILSVIIECRSISLSHENVNSVKYFVSDVDTREGYWSPSTSSIDWCERNYVQTKSLGEFWNFLWSLFMCFLAGIWFVQPLFNQVEKRFLLMSLSFGIVGFGSAYFHETLTYFGQMADELPMVYSMIISCWIWFQMNQFRVNNLRCSMDPLIVFGIIYGIFWSFLHSFKSFLLIFQIHFALVVLGGIIKLIFLYRENVYFPYSIKYLVMSYIVLLSPAILVWLINQEWCEEMNRKGRFNPQFHAWWHIICAVDCHVGIVCAEAMRLLSIKYQEYQLNNVASSQERFRPEDHLRIVYYFGLPFVDYSKTKQSSSRKSQ